MEFIFHEKQIGLLCAQHCLNALLQGPYFNPIDLAEIAQGLDEFEKQQMAVRGVLTREYQQFLQFCKKLLRSGISNLCLSPALKQLADEPSKTQGPEIVSNTYLSLFLTTLQHEGYSVFVVNGVLPDCEAEQRLALIPPEYFTPLRTTNSKSTVKNNHPEKDIKLADAKNKQIHDGASSSSQSAPAVQTPSTDEIRKLRLKFLEKKDGP